MALADVPPSPGTTCKYGLEDGHRVVLSCTSSGLSTWEITLIIAAAIALALIVATLLVQTSQTEASDLDVRALFIPSAPIYVVALGLTIAIESPIYGLLLHVIERTPIRRGIAAGVVVNLVSHPIAFLALFPVLFPLTGGVVALVVVEIVAVSIEASLLWLRGRRDPLVLLGISYLANAASLSMGLLLLR